jgi:hypothetical protein
MGDELNGVREFLDSVNAKDGSFEYVITPDEIVDDYYQWRLVGYRLNGELIQEPLMVINVKKQDV